MTFEEIRDLQISNIISNAGEMLSLVKTSLSIVDTSTLKDSEITMLINAAVSDLVRLGIDVANNVSDGLIQCAIVNYVKANFEMLDIRDREMAQKLYRQNLEQMSLSFEKYRLEVE